jgi:thymidylate synthase
MFRVFDGQTADEVWSQVADAFRNGEGALQPSRLGEMREILHSAMSIREPRQRWTFSRFSPLNPAFAIAEIVWIINGRNDAGFLNYFNSRLPNFAGSDETYHGAYGYRLRQNLGIDQLERAYQALSNNSSSRQIVLQIWDGRIDLPDSCGKEAAPDIPCNIVSILKVRSGKLEWMQIMRSNDLYLGLPYNIIQFTTLQEVLAGWLGLELGEYNQVSNSLHVYQYDLDSVTNSGTVPSGMNVDSLMCSKEESEQHFRELEGIIETIIDERKSAESLVCLVKQSELPPSFRNLVRVLCAEGVRRRKRPELIDRIMENCSNPALTTSFTRWIEYLAKKKEQR